MEMSNKIKYPTDIYCKRYRQKQIANNSEAFTLKEKERKSKYLERRRQEKRRQYVELLSEIDVATDSKLYFKLLKRISRIDDFSKEHTEYFINKLTNNSSTDTDGSEDNYLF